MTQVVGAHVSIEHRNNADLVISKDRLQKKPQLDLLLLTRSVCSLDAWSPSLVIQWIPELVLH